MKKILSLLLVVSMMLSMWIPVGAEETAEIAETVRNSSIAAEDVPAAVGAVKLKNKERKRWLPLFSVND